jgi:ABC-type glycerol-3-phosphate transport system substrate-binding protein
MIRWLFVVLAALVLAAMAETCTYVPESADPEAVVVEVTKVVPLEPAKGIEKVPLESAKEIEKVPFEPTGQIEAPSGEEKETITFMTWVSTPFERAAVEAMVRQFEADNPHIDVEELVVE